MAWFFPQADRKGGALAEKEAAEAAARRAQEKEAAERKAAEELRRAEEEERAAALRAADAAAAAQRAREAAAAKLAHAREVRSAVEGAKAPDARGKREEAERAHAEAEAAERASQDAERFAEKERGDARRAQERARELQGMMAEAARRREAAAREAEEEARRAEGERRGREAAALQEVHSAEDQKRRAEAVRGRALCPPRARSSRTEHANPDAATTAPGFTPPQAMQAANVRLGSAHRALEAARNQLGGREGPKAQARARPRSPHSSHCAPSSCPVSPPLPAASAGVRQEALRLDEDLKRLAREKEAAEAKVEKELQDAAKAQARGRALPCAAWAFEGRLSGV